MDKGQTNLFENYEGVSTSNMVPVAAKISKEDDKETKKLKNLFNNRMKAIKNLRRNIATLDDTFRDLHGLYQKEIRPLEADVNDVRLNVLDSLGKSYHKKSFSEHHKSFLLQEILDHTKILREDQKEYDLSEYEEYETIATQQIAQDEVAMDLLQNLMQDMTGIENLDVKDMMGDEKLSQEEFARKYLSEDEQTNEKNDFKEAHIDKSMPLSAEAKDFELHFMKTYKQLAKRIHPDLEKNDEIRQKKEAMMQELAAAKDSRDLFQLISLRGKVDQIEFGEHVIDTEYLKQYVDYLLEQKKELETHLFQLKNHSGLNSWLYQNFHHHTLRGQMKRAEQYKVELRAEMDDLHDTIDALKTVKGTKIYIKQRSEEDMDDYFNPWL